jgi:hypothetical protein
MEKMGTLFEYTTKNQINILHIARDLRKTSALSFCVQSFVYGVPVFALKPYAGYTQSNIKDSASRRHNPDLYKALLSAVKPRNIIDAYLLS